MSVPRAGQLWLVDCGDPVGNEMGGRRPGLVVGSALHCQARNGVLLVVPVTTRERAGLPHRTMIEPGPSGLREISWACPEYLVSLSTERFTPTPLGRATDAELAAVLHWVTRMIATPAPPDRSPA